MDRALAAAIADQHQKIEQYRHILATILSSSPLDIAHAERFLNNMMSDEVPLVVSRQLLQTFAEELRKLQPQSQEIGGPCHKLKDIVESMLNKGINEPPSSVLKSQPPLPSATTSATATTQLAPSIHVAAGDGSGKLTLGDGSRKGVSPLTHPFKQANLDIREKSVVQTKYWGREGMPVPELGVDPHYQPPGIAVSNKIMLHKTARGTMSMLKEPKTRIVLSVLLTSKLKEKNALFMFADGKHLETTNGYAYFSYADIESAEKVCDRVNKGKTYTIELYEALDTLEGERSVEADQKIYDSDQPRESRERESSEAHHGQSKAMHEFGSSKKRKREAAGVDQLGKRQKGEILERIEVDMSLIKWRMVTDFCSDERNSCAVPFKFSAAERFGSICSSVSMCCGTGIGQTVFTGFILYMGSAFEAEASWGGVIGLPNMVISSNHMCAIVPTPKMKATYENIVKDITSVLRSLVELFRVNGRIPPYFDHLLSCINDIPTDIADNIEVLKQFIVDLVNHASIMPDQKIMSLLQEFHVSFKNLDDTEKEEFNRDNIDLCESNWQDTPQMDKLLRKVLVASKTLPPTFGGQGTFVRHSGVHLPDYISEIIQEVQQQMEGYDKLVELQLEHGLPQPTPRLILQERLMMIAYYFGDFVAKFFWSLFRSMGTRPWISDLCRPFLKNDFEMGVAAPFGFVKLAEDKRGTFCLEQEEMDSAEALKREEELREAK